MGFPKVVWIMALCLMAGIFKPGEVESASVSLRWADTSHNEEGFKIEHLTAGAFVDKVTTVGPGVTSHTDSTLVAGNIYCYRVRAFNSAGESAASNQACGIAQETSVAASPTTSAPGPTAQKPIIGATPTAISPGGRVTASWSQIAGPTTTDWIGLYVLGAANITTSIDWKYVSCSKTPGTAKASGSCPFVVPSTLPMGNYELRLWSNDGFTRLATSSAFIVSTQTPGPIVVSNPGNGGGNGSSSTGASQLPTKWTDYRLSLKLKSMDNDGMGVVFRYQDRKNYYRFLWNRQSKIRRIEKVANGVRTPLAGDSVRYEIGQTYQLEVIAQGQTLKVLIDGAPIFSVSDSSFAEGIVGLYSSGNEATSFDDVVVEDLATGAVLLSEDFNDGDMRGWTVMDRNGNESPSVWSAETGSLVQSSNINGTFALYTLRHWTDYRFKLNMKSLDNDSIGVMFRYQDNNNYCRFSWNNQDGFRRLEKIEKGVLTVLAEDARSYVSGQTYNVEIIAQGAATEVRIDGNVIFAVTDSSLDRGTVALYSWYNQGSVFDDIVVQDLATGVVLLSDDFNDGTFAGWTIVNEGTDEGPSAWSATSGAVVQSGNLGSGSSELRGTFALY